VSGIPDEDRAAAVTIATTEHFNLQTARASTISETNGRASIFLGSVSAGLVAIAFAGQTSRTALYTFGLGLFPVLSFLGLVTFHRTLQTSIDDTVYSQRINRIRRFYLDTVPGIGPYMQAPTDSDDVSAVLVQEGFRPGPWQLLLSVPGMIGVITGVLAGASVGLAAAALTGDNLAVATVLAIVVLAASVPAQLRYQNNIRTAGTLTFDTDSSPDTADT
jgi:hypothetical protein